MCAVSLPRTIFELVVQAVERTAGKATVGREDKDDSPHLQMGTPCPRVPS